MERRALLAIVLSMLILLAWSTFVSKTTPTPSLAPQEQVKTDIIVKNDIPAQPTPTLSSVIKFSQDKFEVIFSESEAAIKEVIFKDYQSYRFPLKYGLLLEEPGLNFIKETAATDTITFMANNGNKKITKRFIFHKSNYTIELEISTQNVSSQVISIKTPLILGVLNFSADPNQARFQDVTIGQKDKITHLNGRKDLSFGNLQFLGIRDRYFCSIIEPPDKNCLAFIKKISPQESKIGLILPDIILTPGQQSNQKLRIYLGPQELRTIKQIKPEWAAVLYYGTFNFISQILLQVIEFIYSLLHNWGWSIVVLSILVYFILYPLTLKQMRSMKEMQVLQPRIEELKKAHQNNPQKLNQEIMGLYREHKINPLGGCLPLLLQMPIFFALYQALIRAIALKGAHFLWIKDLSEPDRAWALPFSVPMLGNEINLLPILMVVTMFIQQKITSNTAAMGQSSEQQKFMLILMPLMFLFIFYHMPAGLVLYWFVNSLLMLIYQLRTNRVR